MSLRVCAAGRDSFRRTLFEGLDTLVSQISDTPPHGPFRRDGRNSISARTCTAAFSWSLALLRSLSLLPSAWRTELLCMIIGPKAAFAGLVFLAGFAIHVWYSLVQCTGRARKAVMVRVDSAKGHVAETAPFRAPPLDLDKIEHAIRRISTPLITMGLFLVRHSCSFMVLM